MKATVLVLASALLTQIPDSTRPADTPKWEAVSVRRCGAASGRGGGARSRGSGLPVLSPGRMTLNCRTVLDLVATAYVLHANGRAQPFYDVGRSGTIVEGGPPWARSEGYTISAIAEGTPTSAMMQGPMLQTILEERFKLRVRRVVRDVDVYAMTVSRGGAKVKPFKDGTCEPLTPQEGFVPTPLPVGKRYCESIAFPNGPNLKMIGEGTTLDEFARAFLTGVFVDRPVVNRTGLTGRFDIELEFARTLPGDITPAPDGAAPPIMTALQEQLGLRLDAGKGEGQFLIIERVDPPTDN